MSDSAQTEALFAAIREAESAADVLRALARAVWHNAHDGEDCPDDAIPDVDQIDALRIEDATAAECEGRVEAVFRVLPTFGPWVAVPLAGRPWAVSLHTLIRLHADGEALNAGWTAADTMESVRGGKAIQAVSPDRVIRAVHDDWRATDKPPCLACSDLVEPIPDCPICDGTRYGAPADPPVRHPLAPLVTAWQEGRAIPATPFRPRKRASLPRFDRSTIDEARLLAGHESAPPGQLELLHTDDVVDSCPAWLLGMFRRAVSVRTGRALGSTRSGMPWSFSITIGGVAHFDVRDRLVWAPNGRDLHFEIDEIINWLHPDGWDNRRRDWGRLDAAFEETPSYRVTVGDTRYSVVTAFGLPAVYAPSANVTLNVRVPPSAARGARFDWNRYHVTYAKRATLQRALLATAGLLDRTAHNGNPLTRLVREPVLDADGKPKRERMIGSDGKPKRDGEGGRYRTRPVFTGELVPNPLLGSIQPAILPDKHLALFLGMANTGKNRHDAKAALNDLERDGVIDLERVPNGYRVFGPSPKAGG